MIVFWPVAVIYIILYNRGIVGKKKFVYINITNNHQKNNTEHTNNQHTNIKHNNNQNPSKKVAVKIPILYKEDNIKSKSDISNNNNSHNHNNDNNINKNNNINAYNNNNKDNNNNNHYFNFSNNISSFKAYEDEIYELKEIYQNREKNARDLINKCFIPPQITYDRFIETIDNCNIIYYKQLESALKIIKISSIPTLKVENEIKKKINNLKSLVEKIDELISELTIYSSNVDKKSDYDEVKELLDDMGNLVNSVKEYD